MSLRVTFDLTADRIHEFIQRKVLRQQTAPGVRDVLVNVIEDAYKRLIAPSIEREVRGELTEKAEEHAISIFSENLRNFFASAACSRQCCSWCRSGLSDRPQACSY